MLNGVELGLFVSRMEAICEEMGSLLAQAAFSPNIKDRLDFSCAIFDARGQLCAQAAHIPVHLGSMAFAMQGIVDQHNWHAGDMLVLNDPYNGGTHLPDVTVIAPVFSPGNELLAFVANRAHHANIGADSPGSMPVSTHINQEGLLISPSWIMRQGVLQKDLMGSLQSLDPQSDAGDFLAQISANQAGVKGLCSYVEEFGEKDFLQGLEELNAYAERLARAEFQSIPDGDYGFTDYMDDDGAGNTDIPICLQMNVDGSSITLDFSQSAKQVAGNINCPKAVTAAAVLYVFRCLLPAQAPACAGLFAPIEIKVPDGSLLAAQYPAAVVAGNVETSQRIVDVVCGALAKALPEKIPAAAYGSMNNIAMGSHQPGSSWHYYETLAGGHGASAGSAGLSARQAHMTNTLNTPVESLEMHYPVRVERYSLRRESGGKGQFRGGDGLQRQYRFLENAELTLITERRQHQPWGLAGGEAGLEGENRLNGKLLPAKVSLQVRAGDEVLVNTPGGGGYSKPAEF